VRLREWPAWCASASANASGTSTRDGNAGRAITTPSEQRATELAARFFDPLLADAQSDTVRATLLLQRGVLYLRSNFKQRRSLI
jgi:hypothetical protein